MTTSRNSLPRAAKAAAEIMDLLAGGRTHEAVAAGDKAAAAFPESVECWSAFACALEAAGDLKHATAAMNMAAGRDLNNPELWKELARLCLATDRSADAATAAKRACELAPEDSTAWTRQGIANRRLNNRKRALRCFRRAYRLSPKDETIITNLFNILAETGAPQALEILEENEELLKTSYAFCHAAAFLLTRLGHTYQAAQRGLQGLSFAFEGTERETVANGLQDDGYITEACASLLRDWKPTPQFKNILGTVGSLLFLLGNYNAGFQLFRQLLETGDDNDSILFFAPYADSLTSEQIKDVFKAYYATAGRRHVPFQPPLPAARLARRRLRVGYLSPDFRRHVCRHFYLPLLRHHDRDSFELFAYGTSWQQDDVTARVQRMFDVFLDVSRMTEKEIADRVRTDEIDILVNLAGHTTDGRLDVFEHRAAPVQVYWMGSLFSTGSPNCDYYIGDRISTPPEAEHMFTETIIRLPHLWATYDPDGPLPEVKPCPSAATGVVTFACFSNIVRLNDRVLRAWAQVLDAVPEARLKVYSSQVSDEPTQNAMKVRFAKRGFDPERLDFGRTTTPLETINDEIDINLDCFPRNSATTTFEALMMGVPTVTLSDRPPEGRVGAAILNAAGLPDLVASSDREYVQKCIRLARDSERRATLRATLREQTMAAPFWDHRTYTRHMEDAYREMWRRVQEGAQG